MYKQKVLIHARIDPQIKKDLVELANAENRSLSNLIEVICTMHVAEKKYASELSENRN